jgi:hypothetical protein
MGEVPVFRRTNIRIHCNHVGIGMETGSMAWFHNICIDLGAAFVDDRFHSYKTNN